MPCGETYVYMSIISLSISKNNFKVMQGEFLLRQLSKGLNPSRPRINQLRTSVIREAWCGRPFAFLVIVYASLGPHLPPSLPVVVCKQHVLVCTVRRLRFCFPRDLLLLLCQVPASWLWVLLASSLPRGYSGSQCWRSEGSVELSCFNISSSTGLGDSGQQACGETESVGTKAEI